MLLPNGIVQSINSESARSRTPSVVSKFGPVNNTVISYTVNERGIGFAYRGERIPNIPNNEDLM